MKNDSVVVLERALSILQYVAAQTHASLAEVVQGTGLGKSTSFRLLSCLETAGLLGRQPETQRYHVGPRVFEYAYAASRGSTLIAVAHPHLITLENEVAETVGLHVLVGDRRICVDEVESRNPVRYVHGVGKVGPLLAGAIGKVFLCVQPLTDQANLLQQRTEMEAELAATRARGYGVSRGEVVPGAASLAAPVFDRASKVVAALSVTGPAERLHDGRLEAVARELCQHALTISRALGYQGDLIPATGGGLRS